MNRSCHPNDALQAAWLKLGAGAFELVVLERLSRSEDLAQAEQRWIDHYSADGVHRVYNAQTRAIRKRRTPLSLDQAAQRLHLSPRRLLLWVREGRVPCHYTPARSSPQAYSEQMGFDRDEIDEVGRRVRQPDGDRVAEILLRLRVCRESVGRWLHRTSSLLRVAVRRRQTCWLSRYSMSTL